MNSNPEVTGWIYTRKDDTVFACAVAYLSRREQQSGVLQRQPPWFHSNRCRCKGGRTLRWPGRRTGRRPRRCRYTPSPMAEEGKASDTFHQSLFSSPPWCPFLYLASSSSYLGAFLLGIFNFTPLPQVILASNT